MAVAYGVFVGMVVYRTLTWHGLYRAIADSAVLSAVILLIISLAGIFAWAGSTLGAFDAVAAAFLAVSDTGWVVLLLVVFLLISEPAMRSWMVSPSVSHPHPHPYAGGPGLFLERNLVRANPALAMTIAIEAAHAPGRRSI
ncbi:MAG: TRAP transporter large permease subunit [Arhodomonas sp.]|nr:TRAP transporter large permease subunit [Arhodomonas sp.]